MPPSSQAGRSAPQEHTAEPGGGGAPPIRVALDAMGGDRAPAATVAGALSVRAHGVTTVLVGDAATLRAALEAAGEPDACEVVHAEEVVGMDEDPAIALRTKRRASIRVAAELVAAGGADALVSAGSTGATLAAALLTFGRIPGIRRPAVAVVLPLAGGVVLVDAGASPDVQPEGLVPYARMGAAYAHVRGVAEPTVGLLNVGAEAGKGNAFVKEAFAALGAVPGFVGNVEPAAVVAGAVDVLVTDGFTGNVFLKTVEALGDHDPAKGAGAGVLLGCAGTVLVAHGAAAPGEIAAALRTARHVAGADLSGRIAARLAESTQGSADG